MKIFYIVYREDNVMVFESQVLEYLQKMGPKVDSIELAVFRHEKNLFRRQKVENIIKKYVKECKTFVSFPVLSRIQLKINAFRLKRYIMKKHSGSEQIAVICRGDLAAYVGSKAFSNYDNVRILFDNRGLPIEESQMSHGDQFIHKMNRRIKAYAINYAKSHCDMYNFVTNRLRVYDIQNYGYDAELPYTIIPTLYHADTINLNVLNRIRQEEKCDKEDFIVTYTGSTAAWQSVERLIDIIEQIYRHNGKARFFILTNGAIEGVERLPGDLQSRIIIKNVPHAKIKYYLAMSNVGIVIRDENIVNQVAAPTKIAEYITSGMKILYSGDIGILDDLKCVSSRINMVNIDENKDWLDLLDLSMEKYIDTDCVNYFDMEKRQVDTLELIKKAFCRQKKEDKK